MKKRITVVLLFLVLTLVSGLSIGGMLEVKPGRNAMVRTEPNGSAPQIGDRLPPGTRVEQIGEKPYYYSIRPDTGAVGWSAKANFTKVAADVPPVNGGEATVESLMARTDVLKIFVLDVEVGDATLIVCPYEDGRQDVILIDTGENDADRIKGKLVSNGFGLAGHPISRMIITHYDFDHCGDAAALIPLASVIYDHGDNRIRATYAAAVGAGAVDRRLMKLDYEEVFSGGVTVECVAVNQATDFDPDTKACTDDDNPNSIALLVSFNGFDYFTGGDLTFAPEKSLAKGIRDCDVYHVNHHGSKTTSSSLKFLQKLKPEVSIASNGVSYGHPTAEVAERLVNEIGSRFYQTNKNEDPRAYQADKKYVADDTYFGDNEEAEEAEGDTGSIAVVVDAAAGKYYVVMPELPLGEAVFPIQN